MNKRIKELASQLGEPSTWGKERPVGLGFAGSRWLGWSDFQQEFNGYNIPLYDTEQLEKFAELIVQKCVSICKEKERPNLYGVREVEAGIKQYFEVA